MERKETMKLSLNEYLKNAGFTEEMLQTMDTLELMDEAYLTHLFYMHKDALFQHFEQYDELLKYQLYLKFYTHLFYQRYLKAKTNQEAALCLDGCKDLYEWAILCHHYFNVYGILPMMWMFLDRLIEGKITRLGRLEFEPKAIDCEIRLPEIYLPKNSVLLNVHVPAGPRLTSADITDAYQQALHYFNGIVPIFHCSSWLLSPQLDECLDESTRIMQFKKDYLIYSLEDNADQFIERVWPDRENEASDYVNYEENTTLQKNAKQLLLSGRILQKANGICIKYYHPESDNV